MTGILTFDADTVKQFLEKYGYLPLYNNSFTYYKNDIGIKVLDIGIMVYDLTNPHWMSSTETVCCAEYQDNVDNVSVEDIMWILSDVERYGQFKMKYDQKFIVNMMGRLDG